MIFCKGRIKRQVSYFRISSLENKGRRSRALPGHPCSLSLEISVGSNVKSGSHFRSQARPGHSVKFDGILGQLQN